MRAGRAYNRRSERVPTEKVSCLVVLSGRAKGRTFQISPDRENVVGRAGECGVCIIDPRMSRKHCTITAGQSGYLLKDLGSANGVFLNGTKVDEAALRDADHVRLGSTELEFHLTERFEDAETKRLKPGEQQAPDLEAPRKKRSSRKLDTEALVEFCSRCQGSIPAVDFTTGRARKVDGQPVCVECLAREIAVKEAAALGSPAAGEPGGDSAETGEQTSAEEVSKLAAEIAEDAGKEPASGAVPVEEDDEFSTDALVFSEEDRRKLETADEDIPEETTGYERRRRQVEETKPDIPLPRRSAKTVQRTPAAGPDPAEEGDPYDLAELEADEIIELDEDDLPDLPEEPGGSLDEDAKTPRPGPEIRVL
jgi:pSer/pThr/pTyr-binding forkhead associated (FHA) protein